MPTPAAPRMPRAQRRGQLLDLAAQVFSRKGYQATSMDDIAGAAGVTKPVLYQHFSSKEELYLEVLGAVGEDMLEQIRALGELPGGPVVRVREGLRRFCGGDGRAHPLHLFTAREEVSPEVRARADEVLEALAAELAGVLSSIRRLSPVQSRVLGRSLIASAQVAAELAQDAADDAERELLLEAMAATMLHGLGGFELRAAASSMEVAPTADTGVRGGADA